MPEVEKAKAETCPCNLCRRRRGEQPVGGEAASDGPIADPVAQYLTFELCKRLNRPDCPPSARHFVYSLLTLPSKLQLMTDDTIRMIADRLLKHVSGRPKPETDRPSPDDLLFGSLLVDALRDDPDAANEEPLAGVGLRVKHCSNLTLVSIRKLVNDEFDKRNRPQPESPAPKPFSPVIGQFVWLKDTGLRMKVVKTVIKVDGCHALCEWGWEQHRHEFHVDLLTDKDPTVVAK